MACSRPGHDSTWLVSRAHMERLASRPSVRAACSSVRATRTGPHGTGMFRSCCYGAEPLLEWTLEFPTRLAVANDSCASIVHRTTILRQIKREQTLEERRLSARQRYHVCDVALSNAYRNGNWAAMQEGILDLTIKTGQSLNRMFGAGPNGTDACRLATRALDASSDLVLRTVQAARGPVGRGRAALVD